MVNFTHQHQFKPLLTIPGVDDLLEVVQETKLLGYWLTSDMKPTKHVSYIISKANKNIWAIAKLKLAGVSDKDLSEFFIIKIRSILECACPVFHSMLTIENSDDIERVQKNAVHMIMAERYSTYSEGLEYLGLESLQLRRESVCLTFALKCLFSTKYRDLFTLVPNSDHGLRNNRKFLEPHCYRRKFLEPQCTTERFRKSPLVYLTRILNDYFENESNH